MLQKWQFSIKYDFKTIKIDAEIIFETPMMERIKLTVGTHQIILESNRPLLARKGLKHKPAFWKVKEGEFKNMYAFELIQQSVEAYLKR